MWMTPFVRPRAPRQDILAALADHAHSGGASAPVGAGPLVAGPRPQLASSSRGSSASACHPWGYDDIDIGFNELEGLRDSGELEELDSVALDNIGNELARAGDVVAVSS